MHPDSFIDAISEIDAAPRSVCHAVDPESVGEMGVEPQLRIVIKANNMASRLVAADYHLLQPQKPMSIVHNLGEEGVDAAVCKCFSDILTLQQLRRAAMSEIPGETQQLALQRRVGEVTESHYTDCVQQALLLLAFVHSTEHRNYDQV